MKKTVLKAELLESREVPAILVPEAFHEFVTGFTGSLVYAGGDFDGNGSADIAGVPAEGSGGSIRVVVRSGGLIGAPLEYPNGPGSPGVIPEFGKVIFDKVLNDDTFRGGAVIGAVRSPDDTHAILAVSPGVGGGPIVNLADLKTGTLTAQLILDINYRGGLRFTSLPPLSGVGAPDSLVMATPAPGGGGGPVATIFDGSGKIVRSLLIGPEDDRSGDYQPYPAGAGVSAPDGSGVMGSYFKTPSSDPFFIDIDGIRRFGSLTGGAA